MAKELLLTEHFDIWSAAVATKSAAGRGSNHNLELYGLKKLRELILELAVRGLLVPQDPRDEPAAALLKQIAAEKARLVKEGKIDPPKKFLPIREDEKPFDLPKGWEWCRFGDIYSLEYGKSLPESKRSGTGEYSVYGSNGVVGSHNESCVKKPCIVVGRKGSAGALNLCLDNECWVTDVAYSVIPPSNLNIEFVFRQLHTLGLDKLGKGIKPGLNRNEAYMLTIAIPPLAEQRRIVAKVDELMALCDRLEQQQDASIAAHQTLVRVLLNALTAAAERDAFAAAWTRIADHFDALFTTADSIAELKQTILQLAVMGKLVPQDPADEPASVLLKKIAAEKAKLVKEGTIKKQEPLPPIREDEQPFQLPDGWEWVRLGDVIDFINGYAFKSSDFSDKGVGVVKIGDIQNGVITVEFMSRVEPSIVANLDKNLQVNYGDLLIAMSGATTGKLGFNFTNEIFYINQRVGKIHPYLINSKYLYLPLTTKIAENLEKSLGSAIPNLSTAQIKEIILGLPPLAEQSRIVAKVDELMALCDGLHARLAASQTTQRQFADAMTAQTRG